jgi:hypothetical protein
MKLEVKIIIDKETSNEKLFHANDLDSCKKLLIEYLASLLKNMNIDFPEYLFDFEYIWFQESFMETSFFSYDVDNEEPWEYQEIYEEVLDRLLAFEHANIPNFSELYSEEEEEDYNYSNIVEQEHENALEKFDQVEQVEECNCAKCVSQLSHLDQT